MQNHSREALFQAGLTKTHRSYKRSEPIGLRSVRTDERPRPTTSTAVYPFRTQFNEEKEKLMIKHAMKNALKPGLIALGLAQAVTHIDREQPTIHTVSPREVEGVTHSLDGMQVFLAEIDACFVDTCFWNRMA